MLYAVGDIHGEHEKLEELLAALPLAPGDRFVFLGDYVDRGPDAYAVIERLIKLQKEWPCVFLLGNHEEVLLRVLSGETSLIRSWLRFGGEQTLRSYGLDPRRIALADESALAALRRAIPEEHVAFLRGFADTCRFGDYLFVHAGIRPGIELDRQAQSDLRWIREPFLRDESDHGFRAFGELLRHLETQRVIELRPGSAKGDPEVAFPEDDSAEDDAFALLVDVIRSLQASGGAPQLSGLKNQLRKRDPDFSEKRYGFNGFLSFCKAARARGLLTMEWDDDAGDYLLQVPA